MMTPTELALDLIVYAHGLLAPSAETPLAAGHTPENPIADATGCVEREGANNIVPFPRWSVKV